jgi:hypothetical protein
MIVGWSAAARFLGLAFAILATLTLTSSNPAPWVPPLAVGYAELLSHREVTLYYPGSRVLYSDGYGEFPRRCQATVSLMCVSANVPASTLTMLAVDAVVPGDTFLWYQEQLSRRGWRAGYSNSDETRVYDRAPGERFQLVVTSLETSNELPGGTLRIYYRTSYSLARCPSIDAGCRTSLDPTPVSLLDAHLYIPPSVWVGSDERHLPAAGRWILAYLVAPGSSSEDLLAWYDRTLTTSGWSKSPPAAANVAYRRGSTETLAVTIIPGQSQMGYSVSGLAYTVLYQQGKPIGSE